MRATAGRPCAVLAACLIVAGISASFDAGPADADSRHTVTITDLGTAGASASAAIALNSSGRVVGNTSEPSTGTSAPVAWFPTVAESLPTTGVPLAASGRATQINDRHQVIGALDQGGSTYAVLWDHWSGLETVIRREALFSAAVDLNDRGEVLVWYAEGAEHQATLWHGGHERPVLPAEPVSGEPLPQPSGRMRPVALNNRGEVAITVEDPSGAPSTAYYWFNGQLVDIGSLGGGGTAAVAIDEHGWIAGTSSNTAGEQRAFIWHNGKMQDLGTLGGPDSRVVPTRDALSNAGHVVGTSSNMAGEQRAFIWHNGKMQDLGTLGGGDVEPVAVNDRGHVVGQSLTGDGEQHAFYWDSSHDMVDLGTLGGDISRAYGLNERGQVVGVSATESGEHHAVLWTMKQP
jgi:probable HAF family extracellular repeat protein